MHPTCPGDPHLIPGTTPCPDPRQHPLTLEGTIMNTQHNADSSPGKDSLLDNLREAGQAWLRAGSRLGDVVSDFTGKVREAGEDNTTGGAHALHDPVLEQESTAGRFRAATREASLKLGSARSADDLKAATGGFASHAEDILRDVAGNVRRAATETKEGESAEQARAAFATAVKSVRESFDEAVGVLQERRSQLGGERGGDTEGNSTIEELRARLDDLIVRAGSMARRGGEEEPETGAGEKDAGNRGIPDIIDGEVISEGPDAAGTSDPQDPKEKDN